MKKSLMKYSNLKRTVLPVALLVSLSLPAWSEETGLDTIVVTATRSDQSTVITPTNITTVTREQIEASGAKTVIEILRSQPGIQFQDQIGDQSHATVSMRGFGANAANNTLILVDGRKLNNPSQQSADLSAINPNDIERIEIIQGSAGVLFGDQAVGGVINIITRAPATAQTHVETSRGTDDLEIYSGSSSKRFDNGLAYRVSFENKHADNYRDHNEAGYSNVFGRGEYNADFGQVFVEKQEIDDNLQTPGALTQAEVNADRRQVSAAHINDFSDRNDSINRLGGKFHLNTEWDLLGEYTERDSANPSYFYGNNQQDTELKSFSPRVVGKFQTANGDADVTAGYDREKSIYKRNDAFVTSNGEQLIQDYYGQLVYPVAKQLSVSGGVRQSNIDQEEHVANKKNHDSATLTELGGSYKLDTSSRVYMRRAESIRYANGDDTATGYAATPFLKPQTGVSKELGYEINHSTFTGQVSYFDMDIKDEIALDPVTYLNINLPDSNRKGLIFKGTWDLSPAWSLGSSYTYTDAQLTSGSFNGNTVPFVPEHQASLSLTYQAQKHWLFYVDSIYTGRRYSVDDDANNFRQVPGYTLFNANASWHCQQLNASLHINNLTGKEYAGYISYPYDYQYPAPERTVELTVGYDF